MDGQDCAKSERTALHSFGYRKSCATVMNVCGNYNVYSDRASNQYVIYRAAGPTFELNGLSAAVERPESIPFHTSAQLVNASDFPCCFLCFNLLYRSVSSGTIHAALITLGYRNSRVSYLFATYPGKGIHTTERTLPQI